MSGMNSAIEAALRKAWAWRDDRPLGIIEPRLVAAALRAIADDPEAINELYRLHDAQHRAPTATAWLNTTADALSPEKSADGYLCRPRALGRSHERA